MGRLTVMDVAAIVLATALGIHAIRMVAEAAAAAFAWLLVAVQ